MKMKSVHALLTGRFASLCLAAQLAGLAFAANAAPADGAGPVTSAIYLQHLGPTDKPIFPVVICETKPGDAELALVLDDEARFARIVTVSKADLRKCLAGVTGRLNTAKEAVGRRLLGTFKVTVTQAKGEAGRALPADTERLARVVAPDAMTALLAELEKTDAFTAPDSKLKNSLTTLKVRASLKEAK